MAPLIALIIGFGFYPKPLLDVINPAVTSTLTNVQVDNPAIAEKGAGQ
jgi:NADH-quinone oxidoreductase subunit M